MAKRQVLLIYSRHDTAPWQLALRAGLQTRLAQEPADTLPVLYEERLDAVRLPGEAAEAAFLAYLASRYAQVKLDLVLTESQNAYDLMLRHPTLLHGVPRFSAGAVASSADPTPGQTLAVTEDIARALQAVNVVRPDTRVVVALVDRSPYGEAVAAKLRAAATTLGRETRLEIWNDFTYADLFERVGQLTEQHALLWFPLFADGSGARMPPLDGLKAILAGATAPVFSHHDVALGLGVVGGYMVSAREVGTLLGGLVLGRPLPDSVELDARVKAYYFDARALRRWDIDASRLPAGSKVVNQDEALWVRYRWHIGAVLLALLLQAGLIVALVLNLRQRKAAVHALAQERALLEQRVAQRTAELQQSNDRLAALSATDGLTGVANRRRFDQAISSEWSRAMRTQQPLALAMVDVDWFKLYNDRYGHQMGDDCLRRVAQVLQSAVRREGDLVARYGGEEFAFICASTTAAAALVRAQGVREALELLALPHESSRFGVVTASIGVAALVPTNVLGVADLVRLADHAMYQAKAQGRNRVVLNTGQ